MTKEEILFKHIDVSNSYLGQLVLQAMQEYADQSKWVSVEEPPIEGQIIDTWNGLSNRRAKFTKGAYERHIDSNNWDRIPVVIYPDIIAWHPLPTPPQS